MTEQAAAKLLTRREVEEQLNVSESTVRRLVRGGELTARKVGRQLRFDAADVTEYLEAARVAA